MKNFFFFETLEGNCEKWCNLRLNWWRSWIWSLSLYLSLLSLSLYIYIELSHNIFAIGPAVPRNSPGGRYWKNCLYLNTLTSPHISDQLGTENACLTLLCWFVVMIWVLVCKNMYRYERYFPRWSYVSLIAQSLTCLLINNKNTSPIRCFDQVFLYRMVFCVNIWTGMVSNNTISWSATNDSTEYWPISAVNTASQIHQHASMSYVHISA